MARAACPGSFDPVTRGHLDVIERAAQIFDEVVVAVGRNVAKHGLFDPQERAEMLTDACADWPTVTVSLFDGLLVEFCRSHQLGTIVKGLRSAADFDYEIQMAQMNADLAGVDTVFLPTRAGLGYVSSSLVREVLALGGDVSQLLPPGVAARARERVGQRG